MSQLLDFSRLFVVSTSKCNLGIYWSFLLRKRLLLLFRLETRLTFEKVKSQSVEPSVWWFLILRQSGRRDNSTDPHYPNSLPSDPMENLSQTPECTRQDKLRAIRQPATQTQFLHGKNVWKILAPVPPGKRRGLVCLTCKCQNQPWTQASHRKRGQQIER